MNATTTRAGLALLLAAFSLGCSESSNFEASKSVQYEITPTGSVAFSLPPASAPSGESFREASADLTASPAPPTAPDDPPQAPTESESPPAAQPDAPVPAIKPASAGRKIIYNATLELVTEDLDALQSALEALVKSRGAYIADSDRTGSAGSTRSGHWRIRVPVDAYDDFLRGSLKLGEVTRQRADSQDVSEEFFDLEARKAAKTVEEARLLKHLTESTGKLKEILDVERELSRVRTELERMQGRLRVLADQTNLATVTITAQEIKGYTPPQAPTLATRVARSFTGSLEALQDFAESLLLLIVAAIPWLILILPAALIVLWIYHRLLNRRQRANLPAS